jgi:hypothetical protein
MEVSKNAQNNTWGDKANAAGGAVFASALGREAARASQTPPADKASDATKPKVKRNVLTADEAAHLQSTIKRMINSGLINPFVMTSASAFEAFEAHAKEIGFIATVKETNVRNAIARVFGIDPSDAKKNAPDHTFVFTAAEFKPVIAFRLAERSREELLEEENRRLREMLKAAGF